MSRLSQVIHAFSGAAKSYDDHARVQAFGARRLAGRILSQHPSGSLGCVLEVGCGTGLLSTQLVDRSDFYVLTDVSPTLLDVALHKVDHSHVVPLVVDGEQLCFSASFDLIVGNFVLPWFQDPKRAISRLVGSLKPGGELYLTTLGNNSCHEWRTAHHLAEAPCGLLDFPSFGQFKDWFPLTGDRSVEEEWVTLTPLNALAFLRTWKGTGCHLGHPGYKPLPPTTLRAVMQAYDQDPQLSYQVLYGYYKKSERRREE